MTPFAMCAVADRRARHLLESAARDRRAAEAASAVPASDGAAARLLSTAGRAVDAAHALLRGLPSPRLVTPAPVADRRAA